MNMTKFFRRITGYFFRGLLFAAPIFITVYVLFLFFQWMDGLIHGLFPELFPGAGILILLVFITFVGFFTKLFFFDAVMKALEDIFGQTPITKLI